MDKALESCVHELYRDLKLDSTIELVERKLAEAPGDRFKGLIGASFSNSPESILQSLNDFVNQCQRSFDINVLYLEMNAFDINYDRWFFDLFGSDSYENLIAGRSQSDECDVTLTGLDSAHRDFEWYHKNIAWNDTTYSAARDSALLLVMTKFLRLVQLALDAGKLAKPIPVLATAHDFGEEAIVTFPPHGDRVLTPC